MATWSSQGVFWMKVTLRVASSRAAGVAFEVGSVVNVVYDTCDVEAQCNGWDALIYSSTAVGLLVGARAGR